MPSTQGQLIFHQSVLELLESKPRNVWNPRSTRILSCCFLHEKVEANASLRNLVLHVLRTLSAVPASSCPSEVLRQIVVHLMTHHAVDRAPPNEEVAGITFHVLSVVKMVLCVKKDAWFSTVPSKILLLLLSAVQRVILRWI